MTQADINWYLDLGSLVIGVAYVGFASWAKWLAPERHDGWGMKR